MSAPSVVALEALSLGELDEGLDARLEAALPDLSPTTASLWLEVSSNRLGRAEPALLERASRNAAGTRRLVLLRRAGDLEVFAGRPERALTLLQAIEHAPPSPSPLPDHPAARLLSGQGRTPLDRWEALGREEALLAIEAVRAEALSHLVRTEDASRAFEQLERRLERLKSPIAPELWVAWMRGWAWFCTEILGRPDRARDAVARVRHELGAALAEPRLAMPVVRADMVACSCLGDVARAAALTDEHLRLAEASGDPKEGCLAWNARGTHHIGQGDLTEAGRALERAIELAREAKWLRREAISMHNLALVFTETGDLDRARDLETRYGKLSVTIGNHAGKAEAPAVLACVALARGALAEADSLIAQARRAAEDNGWEMLVAWARALAGRSRLQAWTSSRQRLDLTQARNELLAAVGLLDEHACAWSEELDPGEVYAFAAAALHLSGQQAAGRDLLARGSSRIPATVPVAQHSLHVGAALLAGERLDEPLSWFAARGYRRRVEGWSRLSASAS